MRQVSNRTLNGCMVVSLFWDLFGRIVTGSQCIRVQTQGQRQGRLTRRSLTPLAAFLGLFSKILVNKSIARIENATSNIPTLGEIMAMAMSMETMIGSSTSLVPLVQFQ
uniref:Uncharacterized protein n=1 Tax=Bionectria ochroleuca TaxID=29856 RepID=A0A8H7K467_BIOOC